MSTFGDSEPADAFDAEATEADPEQVAIRLHEIRVELEGGQHWSELTEDQRVVLRTAMTRLLQWLRDQGVR